MRIDTVSGRSKLTPRREPYWRRIEAKHYIGFRVIEPGGVGTWVARRRRDAAVPGQGMHEYFALGEHAGFDEAVRAARVVWKAPERAAGATAPTVRTACEEYAKAIRSAGDEAKAREAEARFRRLVYPQPLAGIALHSLRPSHFEAWRNTLSTTPARVTRSKGKEQVFRPRSAASVNRDIVPLRAALNRALDDGLVATDAAWRARLRPIKGAGTRREVYLDATDRRALIEAACDEIKPFLRALASVPLRPGAVAALYVSDFDRALKTLRVASDKAGAGRSFTPPPGTAETFAEAARRKLPGVPLFGRADGRAWDKDSWWQPIRDAATAAGLPKATSAYALRHSVITDLLVGGLDPMTVASISGTSLPMIQKHYGHLLRDHAAAALARIAP